MSARTFSILWNLCVIMACIAFIVFVPRTEAVSPPLVHHHVVVGADCYTVQVEDSVAIDCIPK